MDELYSLMRLMTWLSPAFPVGGFAYSGGLERAVADRLVVDAAGLEIWLTTSIAHGSAWNDAVLLAEAHRSVHDAAALEAVAGLAAALAGSAERHGEVLSIGGAFLAAARAWPHEVFARLPEETAYAVAVGAVAGAHGIACDKTLAAYLNAFAAQAVSAGIRLSVLGQRQGVTLLARLEDLIGRTATAAARATLDDLGSAAVLAEISALRHETQAVRLFRS